MSFPLGSADPTRDPDEPTLIQKICAAAGLLMITLGVFLALILFVGVVQTLRQPEGIGGSLDAWEDTLRGTRAANGGSELVLMPEGSIRLATADELTTATMTAGVRMTAPPVPVAMPFNFWRVVAVFVMLALAGMAVRITFGILSAGSSLLSVAQPYRKLYEWVVQQTIRGERRSVGTTSFDDDSTFDEERPGR